MTVDATAAQDGRFTRGRRAFRQWRKARPFWGGLFLILSGLELLYSGNLSLGNIEIHLGLIGFYSYIIPLVVVLCGALTWTLPSQRLFYGIVGNAAVVYSIVSVNLGGFLIGLLLGIVGGALSIAWVPDKRRYDRGTQPTVAGPDDDADGAGPDDAADGLPTETDVPDPNDFFARPTDVDATTSADGVGVPTQQHRPEQNVEGEQRHPFRVRRHALDDSQRPANDPGRHGGRALVIAVVGTTLAASAAFAVRYAAPAAADTCTPTPLQSAIARAVGPSANNKRGGAAGSVAGRTAGASTRASSPAAGTGGTPTGGSHRGSANGTGSAAAAPVTSNGKQPKPVASLVGGVFGLLGGVLPAATDSPSDPPSDPPSAPPTESPSPSAAPTENPTPTEGPSPTPRPTVTSKPKPTPTASGRTATTRPRPVPTATPTTTPTTCRATPKTLAVAPGQPTVNEVPSTQRAALLTMSGLSYDGNVALPTANGTIEVMQFSMTSSTSTPFELDVPVGDHEIVITSSSLTVSGTVKFFTTEIKGNLDGAVPIDFTPSSPPPLTVPELFFTDAVISLVFVQSTTLTADALTISPS
jgi:hypothetical protein